MQFLLATQERSGGRWLQSLLDSHTDICCKSELLNRSTPEYRDPEGDWLAAAYTSDAQRVGWRLLDYQNAEFDDKPWQELVAMPDLRIIRLIRVDKFSQFVSYLAAAAIHKWQWEPRDAEISRELAWPQITVTAAGYKLYVVSSAETEQRFSRIFANHAVIRVVYEDLVKNTEAVLLRLQEFLEVPPQPLTAIYVPTPSPPLSQLVSNYDELLAIHSKLLLAGESLPVE